MIGFDVSLNGRRVCLAGIAGPCVMTTVLSWVERRPGDHPDTTLPEKRLELHVGGLDSGSNENLKWFHESVPVGSEISIRVSEIQEVDEPADRHKGDKTGSLRCSFCNKARAKVAKLVTGPGVNICNECVQVCVEELKP